MRKKPPFSSSSLTLSDGQIFSITSAWEVDLVLLKEEGWKTVAAVAAAAESMGEEVQEVTQRQWDVLYAVEVDNPRC